MPEVACLAILALAAVPAGGPVGWRHPLRAGVLRVRLHGAWAARDVVVGAHLDGLLRHVRRRLVHARALALAAGVGGISPCPATHMVDERYEAKDAMKDLRHTEAADLFGPLGQLLLGFG